MGVRPILSLRLVAVLALACAGAALVGGCARFPAGSQNGSGALLIVTMTVSGTINPSDYYFVVFNNANNSSGTDGPDPVVASPWGNGFVAPSSPGAVCGTSFMEYNGSLPGDGYELNSFIPGDNLQAYSPVGVPTQDTPPNGTNTLEFEIPLSELATSSAPTGSITYLQINFINTDLLPVNVQGTLSSPKLFDALGATTEAQLNGYITISTAQGGTYTNTTLGANDVTGGVEETYGSGIGPASGGDAPNLDITSWSIQITN